MLYLCQLQSRRMLNTFSGSFTSTFPPQIIIFQIFQPFLHLNSIPKSSFLTRSSSPQKMSTSNLSPPETPRAADRHCPESALAPSARRSAAAGPSAAAPKSPGPRPSCSRRRSPWRPATRNLRWEDNAVGIYRKCGTSWRILENDMPYFDTERSTLFKISLFWLVSRPSSI